MTTLDTTAWAGIFVGRFAVIDKMTILCGAFVQSARGNQVVAIRLIISRYRLMVKILINKN